MTAAVGAWGVPTYDIQDTWKPEHITHCVVHNTKGGLRCENIITVLGNQDHVFCLCPS